MLDGGDLVTGQGEAVPGRPLDATRGLASVRLTSRRVLASDAGSCGPAPGRWPRW
ncbi:hypothetical protein [Blastococcus brunescens]|uniref:Uncharacterized protein n=1 Tax=Blastococcus brunescens TaxID=1564165 RepID=A0ABZ1B2N2_9ACTN|nr:hypothetical protein [Blastococcus sp. BMG 8361]WRL65067.1 hypothetical protein U6N30_05050 [Blastococcus sp. BMG 8361]